MHRSVFSIIILTVIVNLCVAGIVIQPSKSKRLTDLYDAAIDILMTCHGDPGKTVGIFGDANGYAVEALRSKYIVPVVLLNNKADIMEDYATIYPLRSFIIVLNSLQEATRLERITNTRWWNMDANYVFIDPGLNDNDHCVWAYNYIATHWSLGLLNAQSICNDGTEISIYNSNQFTPQAPSVWKLLFRTRIGKFSEPFSVFVRRYEKGGQSCESLNFPKTIDVGGWPLNFYAQANMDDYYLDEWELKVLFRNSSNIKKTIVYSTRRKIMWMVNNMAGVMNATPAILPVNEMNKLNSFIHETGMWLMPFQLSGFTSVSQKMTRTMIVHRAETQLFAVTKHTEHKSQLAKILSVIDRDSQIGMCFVYLITFVFFKIFLRQAVMPALLNLVRLTCGTGVPSFPNDLAPTIYFSCLLMFVVTLQGIYTGNLATLLTTTIAYRNVQTKRDIVSLGYTIYLLPDTNAKLTADPSLIGHITEIPLHEGCLERVRFKDSLGACIENELESLISAVNWNLHISRDAIVSDYPVYHLSMRNPLSSRIKSIMIKWVEHGLWDNDPVMERLRLQYVDDEEVRKNLERRVMNMEDLAFAFVILAIGLLCSLICFVGEMVVWKIRLKMAKRRKRHRARLAWGVDRNSILSFRPFNFLFNPRRLLFWKRR